MSGPTVMQMLDAEIERIRSDAYDYGVPDWLLRTRATLKVLGEVAADLDRSVLAGNHGPEAEQFRAIMRKVGAA